MKISYQLFLGIGLLFVLFVICAFLYFLSLSKFIIWLLFIVILVISSVLIIQKINFHRAIHLLNKQIGMLNRGEIPPHTIHTSIYSLKSLFENLNFFIQDYENKIKIIQNIESGNFTKITHFKFSKDLLGKSLENMQLKLQQTSDERLRKDWMNEGFNQLATILREHDELQMVCTQTLSKLVTYTQSFQGTMLILTEEEGESYLQRMASYALNEVQMKEDKVLIGEGLSGQVFVNQATMLITDIPNHWNIGSALGESPPSSILIVPLTLLNEKIGVFELSAYHIYQDYEIEFLERVAENITATLFRIQTNQKTQNLFLKAQKQATLLQKQTEQLIAQEEEIRLNLEELETVNDKLSQNEAKLKHQAEELTITNSQLIVNNNIIESSLNAALTFQRTILPSDEQVETLLSDYFLIYMPKDIVSGDFYWVEKIGTKTIVAAIDCTGHGISGAFMSMIAYTLLDRIVKVNKVTNPAKILDSLHKLIYKTLRQKEGNNNNGMDATIVILESAENQATKMTFSGAKNPLYYIHPEKPDEIQELRGARRAIGGEQNLAIKFTNEELILPKNTLIYMGSDGFISQNDVNRVSFGTKKLKSLLLQNASKPMFEQKEILLKTLENYMENTHQRDDILLLGIQL